MRLDSFVDPCKRLVLSAERGIDGADGRSVDIAALRFLLEPRKDLARLPLPSGVRQADRQPELRLAPRRLRQLALVAYTVVPAAHRDLRHRGRVDEIKKVGIDLPEPFSEPKG